MPLYAALSYDGRVEFDAGRSARTARASRPSTRHQRTDKGFGPALGPAAAARAIARFERVGYAVVQGASDWMFGAGRPRDADEAPVRLGRGGARDRRLAVSRGRGMAGAPQRSRRSRPLAASGSVTSTFRARRRQALSRQIAVEQDLVAQTWARIGRAQRLLDARDRREGEA